MIRILPSPSFKILINKMTMLALMRYMISIFIGLTYSKFLLIPLLSIKEMTQEQDIQ